MENNYTQENQQAPAPPQTDITSKPNYKFSILKNKKLLFLLITFVVALGLIIVLTSTLYKKKNAPYTTTSSFNTMMNDSNYNKAIEIAKNGLNSSPDDTHLIGGIILAYANEGNRTGTEEESFKKAQPYIDIATNKGKDDPETLLSLGYLYETTGKYDEALKYYEDALKILPNSGKALFHKGHVLQFLGKKKEAYTIYKEAYKNDPSNSFVLMELGNAYASVNDFQKSYEAFIKASNAPNIDKLTKAEALTGAALVRGAQDNFSHIEESTLLSKKATDEYPEFSPALAAYGYNLYLTGHTRDSINYVKKATSINPRISRNYLLLSQIYKADGNFSEAVSYLKQAIDKSVYDNTIFTLSDRQNIKGQYLYDLAKLYTSTGQVSLIIPTLKEAESFSAIVKPMLRKDLKSNKVFQSLADKPEFTELL